MTSVSHYDRILMNVIFPLMTWAWDFDMQLQVLKDHV